MQGLVDYDSESSDEYLRTPASLKRSNSEDTSPRKRQVMPPLPDFFKSVKTRISKESSAQLDAPSIKPFREDSWATHVFIKVDIGKEMQNILRVLLDQNKADIEESDRIISVPDQGKPLHISLSRCVLLRTHQLHTFESSIRKHLKDVQKFFISFANLSILTNDTGKASFLTAEVGAGYNELLKCLSAVDKIVERFKHPVFYQPPRFHASLVRANTSDLLQKALKEIPEDLVEDLRPVSTSVTKIYINMGNNIEKEIILKS
ncbi:U6 snRNA phosphodiesterase Usb1 [Phycomyces blakesleeanus]